MKLKTLYDSIVTFVNYNHFNFISLFINHLLYERFPMFSQSAIIFNISSLYFTFLVYFSAGKHWSAQQLNWTLVGFKLSFVYATSKWIQFLDILQWIWKVIQRAIRFLLRCQNPFYAITLKVWGLISTIARFANIPEYPIIWQPLKIFMSVNLTLVREDLTVWKIPWITAWIRQVRFGYGDIISTVIYLCCIFFNHLNIQLGLGLQ